MNNYWNFEEINKRINPNDKIYEGENIPEFFKFGGYYIGRLKDWNADLKTGKILYFTSCGITDGFTFDFSKTNNFSVEDLSSLYESDKKYLLFKPDYGINNHSLKICKEVIPIHLKAREIAEGIYSQDDQRFLNFFSHIPELKYEYGKVVTDNIEHYVNNFDECEFSENSIEIKSYNNISRSFGQDDYKEYSSYTFSIHSDLFILDTITKIIYYNQDNFKTKIGSEIKSLTDKNLEFTYGNFHILKRLIYPDNSSEIHIRKCFALQDTFLLRYYFLKFYNKDEHISHLKKICENGLSVWDTNKIIYGKFKN